MYIKTTLSKCDKTLFKSNSTELIHRCFSYFFSVYYLSRKELNFKYLSNLLQHQRECGIVKCLYRDVHLVASGYDCCYPLPGSSMGVRS